MSAANSANNSTGHLLYAVFAAALFRYNIKLTIPQSNRVLIMIVQDQNLLTDLVNFKRIQDLLLHSSFVKDRVIYFECGSCQLPNHRLIPSMSFTLVLCGFQLLVLCMT